MNKKWYLWRITNSKTGEICEFQDSEDGLYVLHILNVEIHNGAKLADIEISKVREVPEDEVE
jgi:hypothetical protein